MRNIWTITKKELGRYLISPLGYVFAGLLIIVCSWLYWNEVFLAGQANMQSFWAAFGFLASIFVPAISMGLIADEKKNGTWEILKTAPVSESEIIWGKFLGSSLYLLIVIGLCLPTVVTLKILGRPDSGLIVGGMIGTWLLCLAYLALGIFMSSLTSQAIVGFLGATVILVLNSLMGQEIVLMRIPVFFREIVSGLSLSWRTGKFATGLIELSDVVFLISWILIFLWMANHEKDN